MDKYEKLEKLGEGAHGVVSKARVRSKQEIITDRRAHRLKQQQLLLEEEKESSSTQVNAHIAAASVRSLACIRLATCALRAT